MITNRKCILNAFLLYFTLLGSVTSYAQITEGRLLPTITINNIEYPVAALPNITIISKREFTDQVAQYRFNQLKKNLLVVYPYAVRAASLYNELNDALNEKNKRKDQRRYIKQKQDELEKEFAEPLKKLTTTQGELLVKLISRYTGKSVYDLISDYKNPMSAFLWNGVGKMWGYRLKEVYNPEENKDIEIIMRSIENNYR
jgi:hypothetical protein